LAGYRATNSAEVIRAYAGAANGSHSGVSSNIRSSSPAVIVAGASQ